MVHQNTVISAHFGSTYLKTGDFPGGSDGKDSACNAGDWV